MIITIPNPLSLFQKKGYDHKESLAFVKSLAVSNAAKAEEKTMSFKTVLDKIGADAKAVFAFLGSSKGQALIQTGEGAAVAIATVAGGPAAGTALTGAFSLANTWMTEIVKTQALATAAGAQTGYGPEKAAAVLAAVTPEALAFAQKNGLPAPTASQLQAANDGLVAFFNAFALAAPTTTTTVTVPAAAVSGPGVGQAA